MKPNTLGFTVLMLLFSSTWFKHGDCATILMTSPQLYSHILVQLSVGEELVHRGHDVHIAIGSQYPDLEAVRRTGIRLLDYHIPEDVRYGVSSDMERLVADFMFNASCTIGSQYVTLMEQLNRDCNLMMTDSHFMDRVHNINFDLAIVDVSPLTACCMILPLHLRIPFVTLANGFYPWDIGVPELPSFSILSGPKTTSSGFPDLTSFAGRLHNAVVYLVKRFRVFPVSWANTSLLERFSQSEVRTWQDAQRKSLLFLVNNDHHIDIPRPTMPNVIEVGGVTLRPVKPLPDVLETIFANSVVDGVILVSFGSSAYFMPDDVIVRFLDVFASLKQTVIARLPVPRGVVVPRNVKLMSWLPQNDIMGRPETRLFITHCGRNGQHEALFHGVPMLGFPLFGDQPWNCGRACRKGFGMQMDIRNFKAPELYANIRELLDNSTYTDAIRKMSSIFRDQPMIGREKAAFWIEHVIKYGGLHLRSVANDLELYQFLMLDIIAVLFVIFLIFVFGCVTVFKLVLTKHLNYLKTKSD